MTGHSPSTNIPIVRSRMMLYLKLNIMSTPGGFLCFFRLGYFKGHKIRLTIMEMPGIVPKEISYCQAVCATNDTYSGQDQTVPTHRDTMHKLSLLPLFSDSSPKKSSISTTEKRRHQISRIKCNVKSLSSKISLFK